MTEIRFESVPLCPDCSESSEEESAGEREEEVHARREASCFSETSGVSAEHGPAAQTGGFSLTDRPEHTGSASHRAVPARRCS